MKISGANKTKAKVAQRLRGLAPADVTRSSKKTVREAVELDKFYTKAAVARACWTRLAGELNAHGISLAQSLVIEPSAGGGVFVDTAPAGVRVHAFDIEPEPERTDVRRHDFLTASLPALPAPLPRGARVVVGNPPFGSKARLALDFIERAWTEARADVVAFILPVQFRKWSAQRHVDAGALLVADMDLPEDAFEVCGATRQVRCCFQVWVRPRGASAGGWKDLRLKVAPPTGHPDFEAYQYNRMPGSERLFERDWDFAVLRQGHGDYGVKVYRSKDCDRRKQWILFKAHSPQALRRLMQLDFNALARRNTTVPGFGKADVVGAYEASLAAASTGRWHCVRARNRPRNGLKVRPTFPQPCGVRPRTVRREKSSAAETLSFPRFNFPETFVSTRSRLAAPLLQRRKS